MLNIYFCLCLIRFCIISVFSDVVKHDEFLNLSVDQVITLISDDRLLVTSEEQVCLLILSVI